MTRFEAAGRGIPKEIKMTKRDNEKENQKQTRFFRVWIVLSVMLIIVSAIAYMPLMPYLFVIAFSLYLSRLAWIGAPFLAHWDS